MLVDTRIGHSTLTPMLFGRSSRWSTSARATTPYLATQYGPRPTLGTRPANEAVNSRWPPLPASTIRGRNASTPWTGPPEVHVDDPPPVVVGHLDDGPADGDAGVAEDHVGLAEPGVGGVGQGVDAGLVGHVGHHAQHLGDGARARRLARSSAPCSMSASTSRLPAAARRRAVSSPMPLAPPVMTETLPLMSMAAACQTRPHADDTSLSAERGPLQAPGSGGRTADRSTRGARAGPRSTARARRACTPPAARARSTPASRVGAAARRPPRCWARCSSKLRWRSISGAMFTSSSKTCAARRSWTRPASAAPAPRTSAASSSSRRPASSRWSSVEASDRRGGRRHPLHEGGEGDDRPRRPGASAAGDEAGGPAGQRVPRSPAPAAGGGGQPLGAGDHGPVDESVDGGISGPFMDPTLPGSRLGRSWRALAQAEPARARARSPLPRRRRGRGRAPRRRRPGRRRPATEPAGRPGRPGRGPTRSGARRGR